MRDPDLFDTFYKDARERLLLQTYALTGDLAASRAAVRDSFIVAWHHWRKVSALDDPEESVRPQAWRHAQRRHTARLWHRDKDIDPEVKATLDALAKLTITQRRALLLTQLATVTMPQMAREIGLPLDDAERELQTAVTAVLPPPRRARGRDALRLRGADPDGRGRPLAPRLDHPPRRVGPPAYPHDGGGRGRGGRVVITGSMVTDAAGVRPSLDRDSKPDGPTTAPSPTARPPRSPRRRWWAETAIEAAIGGRRWTSTTDNNSDGNGLDIPCQQDRYADPGGTAALVRTLRVPGRQEGPRQVGHPGHRALRHRPGRAPGLHHHPRVVRRLHGRAHPADLDAAGARASATRRCWWCSGRTPTR